MIGSVNLRRTRELLNANDGGDGERRVCMQGAETSAFNRLIIFAGLTPRHTLRLYARLLAAVLVLLLAPSIFLSPLLLLSAPLLAAAALVLVLKERGRRRARAFEADYTALLLSLASAVRTGLDPLTALCQSERLFSCGSELGDEIARLSSGIEQGWPEERALKQFGASIDHPDVGHFVEAFILARRHGSSLSDCLQRLVKVTRQRQSFRRKIKAAVAMQRLSAFGIALCAVVVAAIQALTSPESVRQAFVHPLGFRALCLGILMIAGGLLWMLRLTASKT